MDAFFGPYFDFLELALETWANTSLTQSLWVHDPNHTHSLVSFQWSGLSDQRVLHLTECCLYKSRNGAPTRGGEWFLRLFVLTRWEMVQLVPTKAFLQPAKAAAMCTAPWAETCPPPPILPFLLAQNLSSKRIAPTDNMRPKSDDAIWHHRWLKG